VEEKAMRKISLVPSVLTILVVLFQAPAQASLSSPPVLVLQPEVPQVEVTITLREGAEPAYSVISASSLQEQRIAAAPMTRYFRGQLPSSGVLLPEARPVAVTADFVDNWNLLLEENFESAFPQGPCAVFDGSNDGFERTWDDDDFRPFEGSWAGWPANGGADGVDPAVSDYPANLDSWLICGPFDLSDARDFLVRFTRWLEINDADDFFFMGVSVDGHTFDGLAWHGVGNWVTYHIWFYGVAGDDSVWVGWLFHSDGDAERAEGVWIDNLEVWRYNTPDRVCGNWDPGRKGVVLPPYDPTIGGVAPMIRAGDTIAVDKLKAAGVAWVRLGFVQRGGIVDWQAYDRMVDTLCAQGISVLGLVNHETLVRQDFNNPASAAEYRQAFADTVGFAADHFEGRITYWEVWNEENLDLEPDDPYNAPRVDPQCYAPLLDAAYQSIKAANPAARVLFGGLASAWDDSHQYFEQVYQELNENLGGARPFDYFAVHPYPREIEGPDPQVYMHAEPGYDTIVDKFLKTMFNNNDGGKRVWITEVGWNSSKGSPTRPVCLDPVLVTESEQAAYLKPMFDTLFTEVEVWGSPGTPAVEKVIWYQYMDVGIEDPCTASRSANGHVYISFGDMVQAGSVDWWFGLYRGDKVTPKEAWCAYLAYPLTCDELFSHHIHLPLVIRNR
ncbi:MAG: hypothetical protein ABIN58_06575, partial [candidate division WOR-3 bacterium]